MKENLELWNSVEKTNPNYTKNANVKGNQIISIAPQYQILNATEKFGSYGINWGFKDIKLDYTIVESTGLIFWSAVFYFPNGEMPATNSISVWRDNARTKPDDQFAKKVETDSLTKCLSKLGFNADIFLGKFEDDRYLSELKEEFKEPLPNLIVESDEFRGALKKETTIEVLKKYFTITDKTVLEYNYQLNKISGEHDHGMTKEELEN